MTLTSLTWDPHLSSRHKDSKLSPGISAPPGAMLWKYLISAQLQGLLSGWAWPCAVDSLSPTLSHRQALDPCCSFVSRSVSLCGFLGWHLDLIHHLGLSVGPVTIIAVVFLRSVVEQLCFCCSVISGQREVGRKDWLQHHREHWRSCH